MTNRPAHSPLGASGAERWMHCPGSVSLLKHLELPESDDPSYRKEGTAMHAAAEHCLNNDLDTWEIVGQSFEGIEMRPPMTDAVQVYLDYVRPFMRDSLEFWVEYPVSSPVHSSFYGTLDFGAAAIGKVRVVDLKGGVGIVVEPEQNPQIMYYAFGLIEEHPEWEDDMEVELTIAQPRAWHADGPIRSWTTTVGHIRNWVQETLVPAMLATEYDNTLDPGPWCRFCPAKLVCPLLTSLFGAATKANPKTLVNMSDESIARSYQYARAVEFYLKALKDETNRRLTLGHKMEGYAKLVNKRADRVWKEGAGDLAKSRFGDEAFSQPSLKGPPGIEILGPEGKQFVREFAYTPDTGTTVAPWDDKRVAVRVQTSAEAFADAVSKLEKQND